MIAAAVAAVEVAGRLVGEDQRRVVDERPRDGDALRLAAGHLGRPVRRPARQADRREGFADARPARRGGDAGEDQRHLRRSRRPSASR